MAMAELFRELDEFYREPEIEPPEVTAERINSALFGPVPRAFSLLAWDDARLAGLAGYSFLWPSRRATKSLYLKELYVREPYRGTGVGELLMRKLFSEATENGCYRVEWTADDHNLDAQRFYAKLGFRVLPSKVFYRTEGVDAIRRFAADG